MSYTPDDLHAVYAFLRKRTYDKPDHWVPRQLLYGLAHRWFESQGEDRKLTNQAFSAVIERAGYEVRHHRFPNGDTRYFVVGLDLVPRYRGQR